MWHVVVIRDRRSNEIFFDLTEDPPSYQTVDENEVVIGSQPVALDQEDERILSALVHLDELLRSTHISTVLSELMRTAHLTGRRLVEGNGRQARKRPEIS